MILQLLFDLQARLRTGLAAGGMILLSDPRLPELQKKVGVLAAKSPVFQRLYNLLQSLADDPELFADRLLETLSLLEALLITQAEWKAEAAGEAIVLPAEKAYTDIRYSQLKPLIQALTTTGSGRYEIIEKTYQHHPERFADYRVLPALIADLDDAYGELAELNEQILRACGAGIVPFLKEGFDPAGKKAMLRRIRLIVDLAGNRENAFYRSMVPLAQPAILKEIIRGLACDPDNRDLLMQIANNEKGKLKETALYALTRIRDPKVDAFLLEKIRKNSRFLHYAGYTNDPEITALVCASVKEQLQSVLEAQALPTLDAEKALIESLKLLAYKTGPAITELVSWILDQDAAFSAVRDHQKKPFRTHIRFARVKPLAYLVAGSCERTLSETVLEIVFTSWLADQNAAAEALIKTLVQRWPDKAAALYARMRLIQNFEQAYEELTEAFTGQPRSFFNQFWACVEYDEALKQYVYRSALIANPLQEDTAVIPLGKTLDLRWIDLLTGQRNVEKGLFKKTTVTVYGAEDPLGSSVLVHLADPENELLKQKLSDYFDQRRQTAGHLYFKQVYGLPLKEELLAYLKHSAFGPGQMAMMTRAFCRPREAIPVLNELQDDWKKKRPNAQLWEFYVLESTITECEESEDE